MNFLECPNCKLINPLDMVKCDCGYNFESKKLNNDGNNLKGVGFWLRLLAYTIDIIPIVILVSLVFYFCTDFSESVTIFLNNSNDFESKVNFRTYTNLISEISLLIWMLYSAKLESSSLQSTLGKVLLGIKVVTIDGERLSFRKSIKRNILKTLPIFSLIGAILIVKNKNKQGIHDILSKTTTIKVEN